MGDELKPLRDFLQSAFTQPELQVLLQTHYPQVAAGVVSHCAHHAFVFQVVEAFRRHGLIDDDLFGHLSEARPKRYDEIRRLARRLTPRTAKEPSQKYDFFLSYSHHDQHTARAIFDHFTAHNIRIFYDGLMLPGSPLETQISAALESSRVILVLITHASISSAWVQDELAYALARKTTIVPVLIGSWETVRSLLPHFLRDRQGIHYSGPDALLRQLQPLLKRGTSFLGTFHSGEPTASSLPTDTHAPDIPLRNLAERFFVAARRQPTRKNPRQLNIPERVWIASTNPVEAVEVGTFARTLSAREVGFLIHRGELGPEATFRMDDIRIRGNPIVTISDTTLEAALQDESAIAIFHELLRNGRIGQNLFEARNALVDQRAFFGRTDLLNRVGSAMAGGDQILITGTRKSGKTSFLHMLRQRLSKHPAAWIDLQEYSQADPHWPRRLYQAILGAYDRWGHNRYDDWPADPAELDHGAQFVTAMQQRRKWQLERSNSDRFMLFMDELERIMPARGDSGERFIAAAGALRVLAQAGDRFVGLVAADLRAEPNRRNIIQGSGTNPFFSFFQEIALPPLDLAASGDMVRSLGRQMGVMHIDQTFIDRLVDASGGHAFVTRLMCAATHDARQTPESYCADDLPRGLRVLDRKDVLGRFYEENFWNPLDDDERTLLLAASNAHVDIHDSHVVKTTSRARAALIAQHLLAEHHDDIPMGHFRQWLRRFAKVTTPEVTGRMAQAH